MFAFVFDESLVAFAYETPPNLSLIHICSYTSGLVESAINSRNKPKIGLDQSFIETEKLVSGKGPVSYTHLDVYKRQVEWSSGPVPLSGGGILVERRAVGRLCDAAFRTSLLSD